LKKIFFGRLCPRAFLVISICHKIVLKAQFLLKNFSKKASGRFNFTVWQKSSVHWNIDFLKKASLNSSGVPFVPGVSSVPVVHLRGYFSHPRRNNGMNQKGKMRQKIGTNPAVSLVKLHLTISTNVRIWQYNKSNL